MSVAAKESVWDYPRPPRLEKTTRRLRVIYRNVTIADTTNAYRVLETSHPPTYYISPQDVKTEFLKQNRKTSYCEWKGSASYWDFSMGEETVSSRIWSYASPSSSFKPLKDHFSFYVGPWDCYVDDELVKSQPGDFYGGWMSSDITGGKKGVKGGPGTWGW